MQLRRSCTALAAAALVLIAAACGGSDGSGAETDAPVEEVSDDVVTDAPAETSADTDVSVDTGAPEAEEAAADDPAPSDGAAFEGPVLEPALRIEVDRSSVASTDQVAMSPSGDRVVVWSTNDQLAAQLSVYDATDGTAIASGPTDVDGLLFWGNDDEIIMIGSQTVVVYDAATITETSAVPFEPLTCGATSNGSSFDRSAGVLYGLFDNNGVCRLDLASGAVETFRIDRRVANLAVELGGDEVYVTAIDDDDSAFDVVLDATTLEEISRTAVAGSQAKVLAATVDTIIALPESASSGYVLEPAGVAIPFPFTPVQPSYTGGHYGVWDGGDMVLIESASGSMLGRIVDTSANNAQNIFDWSSDDGAVAVFAADGLVEIYRVG